MQMGDANNTNSSADGLKINLEQMQLNELQKISSQLDNQRLGNGTSISSIGPNSMQTNFSGIKINGYPAGGVISSQPMPSSFMYGTVPGAPAAPNDRALITQMTQLIGMALSSTFNGQNQGLNSTLNEMGEKKRGLVSRIGNGIMNFPVFNGIDYSRTNAKGVEAIVEQSEFGVERAGLQIANVGAGLVGGSLGGKAGAAIGTAIAPGIGTIAGTIVGYAAGEAVASAGGNIVLDQLKDRQNYSTWLQENASRFINSAETNNRAVNSGYTSNERRELGKWLANMNTDFFMSDDEIYTILNDVTDAGLMKSVSDVETFKKKFTSLVDTVKKGAKMLNISYEEMTQMISDLNKEGIKTTQDQQATLNKIKATSDLTGQDASTVYQGVESTKSQFFGSTAVDPTSAFATSTAINLMGSTFMDAMGQNINGENGETLKNMYGFAYNRALNSSLSGEQLAQQMALYNGSILDYGSTTLGQVATPVLAYAAEFDGGVITGFNQERLNEVQSYLDKGDLQGANRLYEQWANSDKNAATIIQQMTQKSGAEKYALLANTMGVDEAGKFTNSYLDAVAYTDKLISEDQIGKSDAAAILASHMGLSSEDAKMAYQYNQFSYSDTGSQALQNQAANEEAQAIRRYSSNDDSVNWKQRIGNKWEEVKQGLGGILDWNFSAVDSVKNWMSGKDTAERLGYGSASFTSSTYEDVYNATTDMSSLYKKAGIAQNYIDTSDYSDLTIGKGLVGNSIKMILSNKTNIDAGTTLKNLSPFGGGNSTKDIKEQIEKDGTLTDEEKQKLLANISTSEGQTQSAVAGYLDLAKDLGGENFRNEFINSVQLDGFGGNKSLDDLANITNIQNLSLDAQKNVQAFLPKALTEKLTSKYDNKQLLTMFNDLFKAGGIIDNETYTQAISDNQLNANEVEQLIDVLQQKAYTNSSNTDYATTMAQDAQKYLQENGEISKEINDSLKTNNETTSETSDLIKQSNDKQAKINDSLTKHIKQLDQQIVALSR